MRKITCIHPTMGRKEQALNTATKWLRHADNPWVIEYIISVDDNDTNSWMPVVRLLPYVDSSSTMDIKTIRNDNRSAIDAINVAAKIATGYILIVVSDDTSCPEHWDTLLLQQLKGKSDFCAKVDDGLQPTLVTMPIIDRIYYERYGYIYQNDYSHMFADQELTAVAILTGKYIKLTLVFPHLHYTTGSNTFDDINAKNNATWAQGEALFNQRLAFNFGIPDNEIVKPYSEIVWH